MQFKDYDIKHIITSPHHPQANGHVERAAQTAIHILRKSGSFLALMIYWTTPIQVSGVSPSLANAGQADQIHNPTWLWL